MTQGKRVLEIRKALNLTMEKFGHQLGVTKVAISNIEKGNRNLTDQMAKSICREFNVNHDYLINGEGEMFTEMPKTVFDELCRQYHCDAEDRNMISEYLKLDVTSRKVLKDYIKAVFGNNSETEPAEQPPQVDIANMSIDEKVAQYRLELEREEKAEAKSEVS